MNLGTRLTSLGLLACAAVVSIAGGCRRADHHPIAVAIDAALRNGRPGTDADVWANVRAFYDARANQAVWVAHRGPSRDAAVALRVLQSADAHGLAPADYDEGELAAETDAFRNGPRTSSDAAAADRVTQLAAFELHLTTSLLKLGHDVAIGRTSPESIDADWKRGRTSPDLPGTLARALDEDLTEWLDTIRPRHPEYQALQKALADLHAQPATDPTVAARVNQIELNLERWRWLPDDLGAQHVIVNIPAYQLAVRENGRVVLAMRAIVGKADNATPPLNAEMKTVVFSPYWNIPPRIVANETAPSEVRDPGYLRRNNIEVLKVSKSGRKELEPEDVDWKNPDEWEHLALRQRPGAKNALGHVKFVFPNDFDVYVHDTPSDNLFNRTGRALSHGCVRVEQPDALAAYVLRDDSNWDAEKIQRAMQSGEEQHVSLRRPLPVHIVYFTVWTGETGEVAYLPDVYGLDAKQAGKRPLPTR